MKRSTASGKNRKFVIIIFTCACRVLQKMLSNSRKKVLAFLLLDNIFCKTLHAHVNIMITNFLFLPEAVLLFIFPPSKPRTSKHPNQIYASKKNSFMI